MSSYIQQLETQIALQGMFMMELQEHFSRLNQLPGEDMSRLLEYVDLKSARAYFKTPVYRLHTPFEQVASKETVQTQKVQNLLKKTPCPSSDRILSVVNEWAGSEPCHVWMSSTLALDFHLPMKKKPDCVTTQLIVLCPGRSAYILTLHKTSTRPNDIENLANTFSAETVQYLYSSLLNFCHRDFVLLPCALAIDILDKVSLQEVVDAKLRQISEVYGGPQTLSNTTFNELSSAMAAVAGVTSVPRFLRPNIFEKDWLLLMEDDLQAATSLLVESLASTDRSTDRITYTDESEFKVKVAVTEAARRLSVKDTVVLVTSEQDILSSVRIIQKEEQAIKGVTLQLTAVSPEEIRPPAQHVIYLDHRAVADLPSDAAKEKNPGKPKTGHVSSTRSLFESISHGMKSVKDFIKGKPETEEEFRFLLLGKTGSGKSTTGNTIMGQELFATSMSFGSVTDKCLLKRCKTGRRTVEIMDSPGLYDTSKTQEEICSIIVEAVGGTHPGPHAILYVVKMGRYTDEEFKVYKRLKILFDDDITKYMVLLFTGGDQMKKEKKTLADMLKIAPSNLLQVVEECNNRALVFDNMAEEKQPQVDRLFHEVRNMNAQNKYQPYTCPKYAMIGEGIEAEVARRLADVMQHDHEREKYIKELEKKAKQALEEAEKQKEEFEARERQREAQIEEERARHEQKLREMEKELSTGKVDKRLMEKMTEDSPAIKQIQKERERDREELDRKMQEKKRLEEEKRQEEMEELDRKQQAYMIELHRMKDAIASKEETGFVEWAAGGIASVVSAPFKWVASWF